MEDPEVDRHERDRPARSSFRRRDPDKGGPGKIPVGPREGPSFATWIRPGANPRVKGEIGAERTTSGRQAGGRTRRRCRGKDGCRTWFGIGIDPAGTPLGEWRHQAEMAKLGRHQAEFAGLVRWDLLVVRAG